MKKILLIILTVLMTYTAQSSHLMGGQITSKNIGGLTYEVTLTLYRDTLGIPMYTTATLHYSDTAAGFDSARIVSVSAPTNIGNGVEMYTYVDTITFPASGNYNIYWSDCCRNAAILNMTNAGGESMYLNNSLYADSTNSSPVFLNIPITLAQYNVPFMYNPLPFDSDGDSLVWALDIPMTYWSSGADTVTGYVLPSSDSTMPFTMDPLTGEISFLPNLVGNHQVSVIATEYRNGVVIGYIRRDVQILVINSPNTPSVLNTNFSISRSASASQEINMVPGQQLNLSAIVTDVDNYSLSILGAGSILQRPTAPVINVTNGVSYAYGNVTWTASQADVNANPYTLTLRVVEQYGNFTFNRDYTFLIKVGSAAGVSTLTNENTSILVYPNPAQDFANIKINSTVNGNSTLEIQSISGQLVAQLTNELEVGENTYSIDTKSFAKGMYLVKLIVDGQQIAVTKMSVK